MANSALLLEENRVGLISEEIELSLRSLQTLLQDLKDDSKEEAKKSKKPDKKIRDEGGIKSFFYGDDDETAYEDDDEEEEEEYPTVSDEDQEKIKELARKSAKNPQSEQTDERTTMEMQVYKKSELEQRITQMAYQNNINYPSDRAFQSIIIESPMPTDVYHLLLDTAAKHNLHIEANRYESLGGGGVYIESVNGIRDGQDGYFWEYIVNGKIPDVSVDKFQVQISDLTELRRLKKEEIKC